MPLSPAAAQAREHSDQFLLANPTHKLSKAGQRPATVVPYGVCTLEGDDVWYEPLNGDFDLDGPVAVKYLQQLIDSQQGIQPFVPVATPQTAPVSTAKPAWLDNWANFMAPAPGIPAGPDRIWGEFLSASLGPGNILANAGD